MRRFLLLVLVLLTLLFASGCTTTTHHMLSPVVLDPEMSLDEKLSSYSIPKVSITFPKVYYDGLAWRDRVMELIEGAEDYLITSAFLASSSEDLQPL